ncbi:MAG: DUF6326 family protein [Methanocella sp.]
MVNQTRILEDVKIDVKLKIAALWATVMLLFAYGDIFGYFRPGFIGEIMAGKVAGNQVDQIFLMFTAAYVTIPSLMVFLSLVLKPGISRPANIVLSIAYAASILLFCVGESYAYYIFLSVLECVLLLAIAWYAWKWPKQESPR